MPTSSVCYALCLCNKYKFILVTIYYSSHKSRKKRAERVAQMGEKRGAYRVLVNKPEERESLEGLSVDGWKNIIMDIQGIEWDGVNWIDLAQDRSK